MKTSTFNRVFSVLAILFLGYSIVCAILAVHSEPIEGMPWYAVVWIAYAVLSSAWLLIVGSRNTGKKQVYQLDDAVDTLRAAFGGTTEQMSSWIKFSDLMKDDPMFRGKRCTCLDCDWQTNGCLYAFDPYNTDGDCLAIK